VGKIGMGRIVDCEGVWKMMKEKMRAVKRRRLPV